MSSSISTNEAKSKSEYIQQILDWLGIDRDAVENAGEFESVSLAETKAFAIAH